MPRLDGFDRAILRILQGEGRMPVTELAERVSLSATPCGRRLKRLEKEGFIVGYSAIVDPVTAGQTIEAYVEVNLETHAEDVITGFTERVSRMSAVTSCRALTGEMDYLLHVYAEDIGHLNRVILKMIVRIDGVRDVRSSIVLETVKNGVAVPIADSV